MTCFVWGRRIIFSFLNIGRNKNLIPGEVISAIINGTEEVLRNYVNRDRYILTGGETADLGDFVRTMIVDSTVIAE